MFIINCKNYEEIAGDKIIKFVKTAEKISKKYKVKIAIAPPQHLIGLVANSSIIILAQHVDDSKVGSTTGFVFDIQNFVNFLAFTNLIILSPAISS